MRALYRWSHPRCNQPKYCLFYFKLIYRVHEILILIQKTYLSTSPLFLEVSCAFPLFVDYLSFESQLFDFSKLPLCHAILFAVAWTINTKHTGYYEGWFITQDNPMYIFKVNWLIFCTVQINFFHLYNKVKLFICLSVYLYQNITRNTARPALKQTPKIM